MATNFPVEVVAADRLVWQGDATQIIATTTEGDIGILAGHIPLIATLAPGRVEVTVADGSRQVYAVVGGFLAVETDRTAIISPYIELADAISLEQARDEMRAAKSLKDAGDNSLETEQRYHRAIAQVKAASSRE